MRINIDKNWSFKDIVLNLWTLRGEYYTILASFSYFETHEKVEFIKQLRNDIYSLNFDESKKDKIWDFMNGNEYMSTLKRIAKRCK